MVTFLNISRPLRTFTIIAAIPLAGCISENGSDCTQVQQQLDSANLQITELQKNSALKVWMPIPDLAVKRGISNVTILAHAESLEIAIADNDNARLVFAHLLMLTPPQYDTALWPSLLSVAAGDPANLAILRDQLLVEVAKGTAIRDAYIALGGGLGMSLADLNTWNLM
ncbi:MAG: hypothetical protein OEW58_06700 [Gammaproteobacteria bacterium]|nr:hypothetical protein [Gammaproteobacteria bacterium]